MKTILLLPALLSLALADRCPELVETKRFVRTFDAPYDSTHPVRDHDPDHHLTPYAAAKPCEDFAETFRYYLRHKGRLPVRLHHRPAIVRKWQFMEWIAGRI